MTLGELRQFLRDHQDLPDDHPVRVHLTPPPATLDAEARSFHAAATWRLGGVRLAEEGGS